MECDDLFSDQPICSSEMAMIIIVTVIMIINALFFLFLVVVDIMYIIIQTRVVALA